MQQNLTFQNISSEDDSSLQNDVAGKQGKNNDVERILFNSIFKPINEWT